MTCMGWGIRVGILTLDWMRGSDVLLMLILFVVGIGKKLQTDHDHVKL